MKKINANIIKQIAAVQRLFLFMDYDGTLTPIVARPAMAQLLPAQRQILMKCSRQKNVKMAIISGRELEDIKNRVGIPGIVYAGNHGLELEGVSVRGIHPAAIAFRQILKKLIPCLETAFIFFPEIFVEDKKFSVSIHYRQLPEEKIAFVKTILLKEIGSFLSKSQVVLAEGKKVWEIRPPTEWNKGRTVLWLLGSLGEHKGKWDLPLYLGDDVTDEDAFRALKRHGITIRVSNHPGEPSEAVYRLGSPEEVYDFFEKIIKIRQEKYPTDVK